MRKLLAALFVLAIIVGIASVADVYVRHRVERDAAARIEQRVPGAHASVHISSFPFVGRLATSGTVPDLTAHVTGAGVAGLSFAAIDLDVKDLRVQRSSLLQGKVVVTGLRIAVVHATITQASLDHALGLGVTLGAGTVGLDGVEVPARLSVEGNTIRIVVAGLRTLRVPVPVLAVLPCVSAATIAPGVLQLSCTTTTVPPALAGTPLTTS